MDYTGYKNWTPTSEELASFYQSNESPCSLLNNEYLIIRDNDGKAIDYYKMQGGRLVKVSYKTIENKWSKKIKPRNPEQTLAIDLLQSKDVKVKLLRGVFGSGKDFLMLNYALELVEKGRFKKIIFIRPNVSVAGVPDIGYLKGDAQEKLAWTLGPIYDKVGGQEGIDELMASEQLELVPLPFIRGRSFEDCIIYVCECQNATSDVVKLLLGRVGEGSELWINGDAKQIDGKLYEKDNGIALMLERLGGNPLFGYVYLPQTERSAVAELATLLD